jgi:hypothetical protein
MNAKKLVTLLLLGFVGVSLAYVVFDEARSRTKPPEGDAAAPRAEDTSSKVVVFYFHGNMRCQTCKTIEAYTKQAVEAGFQEDLSNARLEVRAVNVEEPGNEHYVEDYQLTTRSVVLARFETDTQKEWRNLDKIWDLVGAKPAFVAYVQNEIRKILGGEM